MRILCVGATYPPESSGGYELQCAGAVAHLRAHGHEVSVLTAGAPQPGDGPDVFRELVRFPSTPRATPAPQARRDEEHNLAVLERRLREFRPHVVSWWRMGELSMGMIDWVARAGVPAVGMVCDPWFLDGPQRDPWARASGRAFDATDARWLFVSRALRDQVGGEGDVVHAGIDLALLEPVDPPPWRGRLLCAGRLSRLKGVDTAVDALGELPDATLALVGDGAPELVTSLRERAGTLGVADRLSIRPALPASRMAATYAAADAVLFPVRWAEPWGLVPLEAMAVGRPVVATGTGGSAEYLRDGENALLVAPDDPTALAGAVRRLASDPTLRERLRAGGRATAEAHPAEHSHAAVRRALEAAGRAVRFAPDAVRCRT